MLGKTTFRSDIETVYHYEDQWGRRRMLQRFNREAVKDFFDILKTEMRKLSSWQDV